MLRITTRVAHVKGVVARGETMASHASCGIDKMPGQAGDAAGHRPGAPRGGGRTDGRNAGRWPRPLPFNRIEAGDTRRGFITSGVSYLYVKEAFPEAAVLKLGMCWPLPEQMIRDFAASVDELYMVEELDPFLETHIKAMGIACHGKDLIPDQGELNTAIVRKAIEPGAAGSSSRRSSCRRGRRTCAPAVRTGACSSTCRG